MRSGFSDEFNTGQPSTKERGRRIVGLEEVQHNRSGRCATQLWPWWTRVETDGWRLGWFVATKLKTQRVWTRARDTWHKALSEQFKFLLWKWASMSSTKSLLQRCAGKIVVK